MTDNISTNEIRIVIGSWGSYNACNERALGSSWITLSDFSDWEEIEEVLHKQGFQLHGVDEELFVQDIENLPADDINFDYMSPKRLFEILKESEVINDSSKYEIFEAFLEVRGFRDFEERVEKYSGNWTDDIYIYRGYDFEDYGKEAIANSGLEIPECLEDYFDYEAYGESLQYSSEIEKFSGGLIEIN